MYIYIYEIMKALGLPSTPPTPKLTPCPTLRSNVFGQMKCTKQIRACERQTEGDPIIEIELYTAISVFTVKVRHSFNLEFVQEPGHSFSRGPRPGGFSYEMAVHPDRSCDQPQSDQTPTSSIPKPSNQNEAWAQQNYRLFNPITIDP